MTAVAQPGAQSKRIETNGITCHVVTLGQGPLVLMVHGFPELWFSWRHQLAPIAAAGFTAAAMDVRGYGDSSRPHPVDAYDMQHIAADIAGIADQLGGGKAILFGHDWGAPIVYSTALLYPEKIAAVAGLSVPCMQQAAAPPLALMKEVFKDRFFYQNYFQEEGVAEREFQRNARSGLRKFYYAICGDAPAGTYPGNKAVGADLLTDLPDPDVFPDWLPKADEDVYVEAFTRSGFRGPINRYRCQDRDWHVMQTYAEEKLSQPALFIGGERDPVRHMAPGRDAYETVDERLADCRGKHIIPSAGHWVQQEAPDICNELLVDFVRSL